MNFKYISPAILSAALLLGACSSPQNPAPQGPQKSPGIETDIASINKAISHTLDAMLIKACGRGTHPLSEIEDLPPKEQEVQEIYLAIDALNHSLDCRTQEFSGILAKREDVVRNARLMRPDIVDAADYAGKAGDVLTIPNLTEEIRQATATNRRMEDLLLQLMSKT